MDLRWRNPTEEELARARSRLADKGLGHLFSLRDRDGAEGGDANAAPGKDGSYD